MHDVQHAVDVLGVHFFQFGHDGQIFAGRQVQIAGRRLDQTARLAQQGDAVLFVHHMAQQLDAAAGGVDQAEDHLHARGFSRAVGAEKTVDAPLRDGQVEVIDHKSVLVALAQVVGFDDRFHYPSLLFVFGLGTPTGYTRRLNRAESPA